MGVPAFFRWLSRKYPSVITECVEQRPTEENGGEVDASLPNPNGVEFDNLYLDMNGIIHPCTHPEDKPAPKNEDEMMVAIFECIDRLFKIVRPRKVLYMAIDGVAPRAKMNQQRSRRFRASKETQEKIIEVARIREELTAKGIWLPPQKEKGEHFDSNCITPGTPFMDRLSKCLHYYVYERLNNDPGWKGVKVILSDANVPGEGEHKIMDYIRRQRAQEDHDPNTQHVLCGADADLIMLGLATHEPYFTIIREEFKPNKPRPCDLCGQLGHEMKECQGTSPEIAMSGGGQTIGVQDSFIFVRLNVLREYLERELNMPDLPFPYDFERALDDWVFMCFFVGNDFLPHLPSLEIREGAVDRLVNLYKKTVFKTGGWLTDSGDVNLDRVQLILTDLGLVEDQIFKSRQQQELAYKAREKNKKRYGQQQRPNFNLISKTQFAPTPITGRANPVVNARQEAANIRIAGMHSRPESSQGHGVKRKSDDMQNGSQNRQQEAPKAEEKEEDDQAHDEVRLWEEGFKDRYYESKFEVSSDQLEFRYRVALQYVRGLCWVLRYYYQGCASWTWYFPYHYAPFASDFVNIGGLSTQFEDGTEPFRPLEQLMGVFPAASKSHVPEPWGELMSNHDSPIIDFYPEDFKIDLNGKKFAWQGVALLPFVDENRLFKALVPYYQKLTREEVQRNTRGNDVLYIGDTNPSYSYIKSLYLDHKSNFQQVIKDKKTFSYNCQGVRGTIMLAGNCVEQQGQLNSPICGLPPVRNNIVVCTRYCDPTYGKGFIFPAKRLKGAIAAPRVLKPGNLDHQENRNWKPRIGMGPRTNQASLDSAGHRMLSHHAPNNPRNYSNIPPPSSGYGGYNSGNRNDQSNRGPYRSGYQGQQSDRQNNRDRYQGAGSRGGGNWSQQNSQQSSWSSFKNDRGQSGQGYNDNRNQNRGNYGNPGPPQHFDGGQGNRPYQGAQRNNNQGWQQRSQPYNRNQSGSGGGGGGYGYRQQ